MSLLCIGDVYDKFPKLILNYSQSLVIIEIQILSLHDVDNIYNALDDADVIMPLRIQLERQKQGNIPSLREYSKYWGINSQKLKIAKKDVLIMHPGPVNEGIEITTELVNSDKSLINEQVKNGLYIRMAIIKSILSEICK